MNTLMERVHKLEKKGIFLGGPNKLFEDAGRKTLITLLNEGLTPNSKVLDIGCGCLRIGYWLIHFLTENRYYGIEPNVDMVNAGIRILLEPELVEIKQPKFDYNNDFDFTVFEEKFDFFMARSIWTHASKQQIQAMLDGFVNTANTGAVFITSYIKPTLFKRDYKSTNWVGKSHTSDAPGTVAHSLSWIQTECSKRSLVAEEIMEKAYNFGNQKWIRIKHKPI